MPRPYSIDLRTRVIIKHEEGKSVTEISKELNVKNTFVYDMIRLFNRKGSVEPKPASGGQKPKIDEECLLQIEATIIENPDMTLQEIKDALGLNVSISTLCDAINKKLNLRYKKNSIRYRTE